MRAGEVCRMKASDIEKKLNLFYVRGERLKTKSSNRVVSIHSHLIELGLYEFVRKRKERLMEHYPLSVTNNGESIPRLSNVSLLYISFDSSTNQGTELSNLGSPLLSLSLSS